MKKKAAAVLAVLLLSLLLLPRGLYARIISEGVYRGYYFVDRWGQKVLNRGTSYTFVSDVVARQLQESEGKPVELNVTKMSQPINPGAGMIMAADKPHILKAPLLGLQIEITVANQKVAQGDGIKCTVSLKNTSKEDISLWPGAVFVVIVTNHPFSNEAIGYKDPEDRAYWYHQHAYGFAQPQPLLVACREEVVPWKTRYLVEHGKKIDGRREPQKYVDDVAVFGPGGEFSHDLLVGRELLEGTYEVFGYVADEFPSPMSNRIAFDVVKENNRNPQPAHAGDAAGPRP